MSGSIYAEILHHYYKYEILQILHSYSLQKSYITFLADQEQAEV